MMNNRGFLPLIGWIVVAAASLFGLGAIGITESLTGWFSNLIFIIILFLIGMILFAKAVEFYAAQPDYWLMPAIMGLFALTSWFFMLYTVFPGKFAGLGLSVAGSATSAVTTTSIAALSIEPVPVGQSVLVSLPGGELSLVWLIIIGVFAGVLAFWKARKRR